MSIAKWEAIDWSDPGTPDDCDTLEGRLQWASGLCGCGSPEDGWPGIRRLLEMHVTHEEEGRYRTSADFDAVLPDPEIQAAVLWLLDAIGYTEHGGSVCGAWLSERGKQVLGLVREVLDGE